MNAYMLEMSDRLLLTSIRYQLDGFLEYTKDFSKGHNNMSAEEMRGLFEHYYMAKRNVVDGIPIESIAPWWVKQILAGMSCLNQPSHVQKDT